MFLNSYTYPRSLFRCTYKNIHLALQLFPDYSCKLNSSAMESRGILAVEMTIVSTTVVRRDCIVNQTLQSLGQRGNDLQTTAYLAKKYSKAPEITIFHLLATRKSQRTWFWRPEFSPGDTGNEFRVSGRWGTRSSVVWKILLEGLIQQARKFNSFCHFRSILI